MDQDLQKQLDSLLTMRTKLKNINRHRQELQNVVKELRNENQSIQSSKIFQNENLNKMRKLSLNQQCTISKFIEAKDENQINKEKTIALEVALSDLQKKYEVEENIWEQRFQEQRILYEEKLDKLNIENKNKITALSNEVEVVQSRLALANNEYEEKLFKLKELHSKNTSDLILNYENKLYAFKTERDSALAKIDQYIQNNESNRIVYQQKIFDLERKLKCCEQANNAYTLAESSSKQKRTNGGTNYVPREPSNIFKDDVKNRISSNSSNDSANFTSNLKSKTDQFENVISDVPRPNPAVLQTVADSTNECHSSNFKGENSYLYQKTKVKHSSKVSTQPPTKTPAYVDNSSTFETLREFKPTPSSQGYSIIYKKIPSSDTSTVDTNNHNPIDRHGVGLTDETDNQFVPTSSVKKGFSYENTKNASKFPPLPVVSASRNFQFNTTDSENKKNGNKKRKLFSRNDDFWDDSIFG